MSAFIVSDVHIDAIVSYASRESVRVYPVVPGAYSPGLEQEAGACLYRANAESVNRLYAHLGEKQETEGYTYTPDTAKRTPVEIIKLCDCLEYQSNDAETWSESQAARLLGAVRRHAIHKLPGYESAQWAIDA